MIKKIGCKKGIDWLDQSLWSSHGTTSNPSPHLQFDNDDDNAHLDDDDDNDVLDNDDDDDDDNGNRDDDQCKFLRNGHWSFHSSVLKLGTFAFLNS